MTSGIGRRPGLTSKTLVSPHSHTGDDIVDGSIVNADIGAAAAIAQSKIANLTSSDLAGKHLYTHILPLISPLERWLLRGSGRGQRTRRRSCAATRRGLHLRGWWWSHWRCG